MTKGRAQIALVLCALIILACRLYTYAEPLQNDLTLYALISHEMLQGRHLYEELFDHKPPGIFVTYGLCELIAGFGPPALFLASLLPSLLTLVALWWSAALLFKEEEKEGRWYAAVACGVLWSLVSGDLLLEANQANTELFQSCFKALGFAFLLSAASKTSEAKRSKLHLLVLSGVFFAFASFYKQTAALTAFFVAVAHVISHKERPYKNVVIIGLIGLIFWLGVVGYFTAVGRFDSFWLANVTYNSKYAGASGWDLPQKILATININHLLPMKVAPALFLCTLAGVFWGMAKRRHHWLMLLAWLGATVVEIALAGRYYSHYYQLFLPPLVLGTVWALVAIAEKFSSRSANITFVLVLLAVAYVQVPNYLLPPEQWALDKYPWLDFPQMRDLGEELPLLLREGEHFYQWGESTGLYFYAKQRPPVGVIYSFHAQYGPLRDELSKRLLLSLKNNPPELILVDRRRAFFGPVPKWLMENYEPLPKLKQRWKLLFLGRKGGRLASLYGEGTVPKTQWKQMARPEMKDDVLVWQLPQKTFLYGVHFTYGLAQPKLAPKCKLAWSAAGKEKEQGAVLEPGIEKKEYFFWIWDDVKELRFSPANEKHQFNLYEAKMFVSPRGNPVPH